MESIEETYKYSHTKFALELAHMIAGKTKGAKQAEPLVEHIDNVTQNVFETVEEFPDSCVETANDLFILLSNMFYKQNNASLPIYLELLAQCLVACTPSGREQVTAHAAFEFFNATNKIGEFIYTDMESAIERFKVCMSILTLRNQD